MNVFETVKRLLTEFEVSRINYETIKPGEARKIASFNYIINNIRYSFSLRSPMVYDLVNENYIEKSESFLSLYITIDPLDYDSINCEFKYSPNDAEKQLLNSLMYEVDNKYYKNLLDKVNLPIKGIEANDPNAVDIPSCDNMM